ncbi:MAG: MarR family transcriptional regulator [Eubacteriaceae bacterium]|nr:MarR family transcriptional regulator [Eubacteriaceae bacterium]
MSDTLQEDNLASRLVSSFLAFGRTPWHKAPASGLSIVSTSILEYIYRANRHGKSPRVSDLGVMLRVSSSTITQHINNLEKQGFVERTHSKEDKRNVNLSLTEKGDEALESHRANLEMDFAEFANVLGEERSELLIDMMYEAQKFFTLKSKMREIENLGVDVIV